MTPSEINAYSIITQALGHAKHKHQRHPDSREKYQRNSKSIGNKGGARS